MWHSRRAWGRGQTSAIFGGQPPPGQSARKAGQRGGADTVSRDCQRGQRREREQLGLSTGQLGLSAETVSGSSGAW